MAQPSLFCEEHLRFLPFRQNGTFWSKKQSFLVQKPLQDGESLLFAALITRGFELIGSARAQFDT